MSDKELPLVTVVTPTYNRVELLAETIDSILAQDYPRFEYIIIDDGSTDQTKDLVSKYGDRIRYFYHQNQGEAYSTNRGWELAQGDYFAMVSSDDPMLPGWLSKAVEFMEEHPQAIVGYPDWVIIDEDSKQTTPMVTYEYALSKMIAWLYCLPGPGTLIRKSKLQDVKELRRVEFRYAPDFQCWLRLALIGPFIRIPYTLATWRNHPGSITMSVFNNERAFEMVRIARWFFRQPNVPSEIKHLKKFAISRAYYTAALITQKSDPLRSILFYWRSLLESKDDPDGIPEHLKRNVLFTNQQVMTVLKGKLKALIRRSRTPQA